MERSKYNVGKDEKDIEKRTCDGIVFDSIVEMRYYRDVVCPLVESGDIVKYELQKTYELQPKFKHDGKNVQAIRYVADFFLVYKDGHEEVVDTKGCPDSVAKMKRKMFWYIFPETDYRWICYSKKYGNEENGGWCDYEYVNAQRKKDKLKKKLEKANEENTK